MYDNRNLFSTTMFTINQLSGGTTRKTEWFQIKTRENYMMALDNNSPNATDYPRKTEQFHVSAREKITFCPQITTVQM